MDSNIIKITKNIENKLIDAFIDINNIRYENQIKVLNAFRKNKISETHFAQTTGYGYNDAGRDIIEKVYSDVFLTEDSLVRHQIISGTHALSICLFACLKNNDLMLSVVGEPYDTLKDVIGLNDNKTGSLVEAGVRYDYVPLKDLKIDYAKLDNKLEKNPKLCLIQRSRGYDKRNSLSIEEIKKVVNFIREKNTQTIILVDNCYGEFIETIEPGALDVDLLAGSLIKNPGGGIASGGGYISGKKEYINLCQYKMTCPGIGREIGPSLGKNKEILQGLFFAPHIVSESMKSVLLVQKLASKLGYKTYPDGTNTRTDIVQAIEFNSKKELISFCQSIQKYSPIDSFIKPIPWDMPGYNDKIIMACGAFTQGSSIELSCDAPLKPPYIAYLQGGLFYDHTKYAVINAFSEIMK